MLKLALKELSLTQAKKLKYHAYFVPLQMELSFRFKF